MASSSSPLVVRVLREIAELQRNPYPGIVLHFEDKNFQQACLILTPDGEDPLHLKIVLGDTYPLTPPVVTIQSKVNHPNVYGSWICCNILQNYGGYTPAYSLKGICIQLLSFFSSDRIEQMHGEKGGVVERSQYQRGTNGNSISGDLFACTSCNFGFKARGLSLAEIAVFKHAGRTKRWIGTLNAIDTCPGFTTINLLDEPSRSHMERQGSSLDAVPAELLLHVADFLSEEDDLVRLAQAYHPFSQLMHSHRILQRRELQCFVLKQSFEETELGIGVCIQNGILSSEFDFISRAACYDHQVWTSVQGLRFDHWLPLPLSKSHWRRILHTYGPAQQHLAGIAHQDKLNDNPETVVVKFMNDIVVRLCDAAKKIETAENGIYEGPAKSALTHTSEKAVQAYFQLFHLLLCLATEQPSLIDKARLSIEDFNSGKRNKMYCPNLGYLLVQMLLCCQRPTEYLMTRIVREAVTRNVVWMLDQKGAGLAELSYLEDGESSYRLKKTFEASKTSYRLLMFLNLMRHTVQGLRLNSDASSRTQSDLDRLIVLRDLLYQSHGAPPDDTIQSFTLAVRQIQSIDSFPGFLKNMNIAPPSAAYFSAILRDCVRDSMSFGYSRWAITQEEALIIRLQKGDLQLKIPPGMMSRAPPVAKWRTFFPEKSKRGRTMVNRHTIARGRGTLLYRGRGRGRGRIDH